MNLTDDQRDLLRDVLNEKRERINRAAEGLLHDVHALDLLLASLHVSEVCERDSDPVDRCTKCGAAHDEGCQLLPSLCPNCGAAEYHEQGECP